MDSSSVAGSTGVERFDEVLALIHGSRQKAIQAVNTQLIELYWQVGAYISRKQEQAEWGDAVIGQLAEHLAKTQPALRGFTQPNLFRMRQFYETYRNDEKVSPLVRQLPWPGPITWSSSARANARKNASFTCVWRFRRSGRSVSWNANSKRHCSNAA